MKTWHRRIETGVKVRREKWSTADRKMYKGVCLKNKTTSLSERQRGHWAADRGPEGPEYAVPEQVALLTEWMMPCRA